MAALALQLLNQILSRKYLQGLFITYIALYLMAGDGQPALVYIVPCILATMLFLGYRSGELNILWKRGVPAKTCPHLL